MYTFVKITNYSSRFKTCNIQTMYTHLTNILGKILKQDFFFATTIVNDFHKTFSHKLLQKGFANELPIPGSNLDLKDRFFAKIFITKDIVYLLFVPFLIKKKKKVKLQK